MLNLLRLLPNKIRVAGLVEAESQGRDLLELSRRELRQVRGGRIGFVFRIR